MYDLASVRAQLPTLRSFTYLNTGTLGLMAEPVLARYREAVERAQRFGHLVLDEFQEASERVRSELAELLGVRSKELAFTGNTTDGIALVLASFPFEAGDRILTSDQEHPAVLLPLTLACRRRGVVVERFRVGTEKEETQEAFGAALMRTRPRLVVVSHVSCETGVRLPIEDMTRMAQAEGARVLLDTAQSIGQFPVNLAGLGVDFAAGNGHKWLHGPQGTGFLYVRQDNLDLLEPPLVGDGAVVPPFDRHSFQFDGTNWSFRGDARRFEYGTRDLARVIGLGAAIEYLAGLGWEAIAQHQARLVATLRERLEHHPSIRWYSATSQEDGSGLVTLGLTGWNGERLSRVLWEEYRIVQRRVQVPNGVRVSCAYFTSEDDLDRLVSALEELARYHR